jgi:hypothetical protein
MGPVIEGPSDAQIERLLLAAPEARWRELWDAVADLDAAPEPGRWAEGEPTQMPYVVYGEAVHRTIECVQGLGASVPFDWRSWKGLDRYAGGRGLDAAPVAEAIRLVTAIVRADRFSEGTILAAVRDGTLRAAISRLRRWHEENR